MFSVQATFYRNRVLIPNDEGLVSCYHLKSGKFLWSFQADHEIHAPVHVQDEFGILIASCSSKMQVFNLNTGEHFKDIALPEESTGPFEIKKNLAFIATMRGNAICLDWKTEKNIWTKPLQGDPPIQCPAGVALDSNIILVGADDRKLRALNSGTGNEIWSFPTKGTVNKLMKIHGGNAIVTTSRGFVYMIGIETGKLKWSREFGGSFSRGASIGNDQLIVTNGNGKVYSVRIPSASTITE